MSHQFPPYLSVTVSLNRLHSAVNRFRPSRELTVDEERELMVKVLVDQAAEMEAQKEKNAARAAGAIKTSSNPARRAQWLAAQPCERCRVGQEDGSPKSRGLALGLLGHKDLGRTAPRTSRLEEVERCQLLYIGGLGWQPRHH